MPCREYFSRSFLGFDIIAQDTKVAGFAHVLHAPTGLTQSCSLNGQQIHHGVTNGQGRPSRVVSAKNAKF